MRQEHHLTLKFHTIYSLGLALIFVVMMLIMKSLAFGLAVIFLMMYIAGNGIIHIKKNKLTRDTIIEYVLVSLVVLVIFIDLLA